MILIFFLLNHSVVNHPIMDSLSYHYSCNQPDTLFMTAECSLIPDEEIKIYYSKKFGLQVKSDGFSGEIVKGLVMLTGIGICEFWKSLGTMDTVISEGNFLTLIPEENNLFSEARLEIDKQQWLIKAARVRIDSDTVFAKITYDGRTPLEIAVKGSSNFTVRHKYKNAGTRNQIPLESTVSFSNDLPDIEVKYKLL